MRRHLEVMVLLGVLVLLALFVHAQTWFSAATAERANGSIAGRPLAPLDRPTTKFELLFNDPDLALP